MKGEGLTTKFFGVQLLLYLEAMQSYCLIAAIPIFPCKFKQKRRKKGKKEWGSGEMCGEKMIIQEFFSVFLGVSVFLCTFAAMMLFCRLDESFRSDIDLVNGFSSFTATLEGETPKIGKQ